MWPEQCSVETFHRIYAKSEPAVACKEYVAVPMLRRVALKDDISNPKNVTAIPQQSSNA